MTHWKKNLALVWVSQFLSIAGFSFSLPFAPYFMQDLGVTDPDELKIWVTVFAVGAPLSLAIFSPLWGILADRYGRRLMLLRANFGAALFLAAMGSAPSVQWLVGIRFLQGVLTGTMSAAQAMISASTPVRHNGFAIGTLSSAVFSGSMAGAALGGIFADAFGYRNAFYAAGLLLLLGALLILPTREAQPGSIAAEAPEHSPARQRAHAARLTLGILGLMAINTFLRRFDNAFLPLLVQEIHGRLEGAAAWTGYLSAAAGVAGFAAALILGRLADRVNIRTLSVGVALAGGLTGIPQAFAASFAPLFFFRFWTSFFLGGVEPVLTSWLARRTAQSAQGRIFGWMATARSVGWILAPLLSGWIALRLDVRAIFVIGGIGFACMAPVSWLLLRGSQTAPAE